MTGTFIRRVIWRGRQGRKKQRWSDGSHKPRGDAKMSETICQTLGERRREFPTQPEREHGPAGTSICRILASKLQGINFCC